MQPAYPFADKSLYDFLQEEAQSLFDTVKTIRETERGSLLLLKHRESGRRYVLRSYKGNGEVYKKLLSVNSVYLPRIYEATEKDGQTLVLEEYISGDTLHEMLRGALFLPSETRTIVKDICNALYILHGLGAVHRDIKPENVILRSGGAVLIDFDASRLYKPESDTDTKVLGTTGYAAPEQFGFGQTDARSDIYSLGVLINIMLTGKFPSQQLAGGSLGRVVRRCTQTSPAQRYQNVVQLMEAL